MEGQVVISILLIIATPVIWLVAFYISRNTANRKAKLVTSIITWVIGLFLLSSVLINVLPLPYSIVAVALALVVAVLIFIAMRKANAKKCAENSDELLKQNDKDISKKNKIIRPPFIIVVVGLILSLTALVLIARSGSVAIGWFAFAVIMAAAAVTASIVYETGKQKKNTMKRMDKRRR